MKGVVTPCEDSQSFDRNSDHYLHLHTYDFYVGDKKLLSVNLHIDA
jgi:hypothetical protein